MTENKIARRRDGKTGLEFVEMSREAYREAMQQNQQEKKRSRNRWLLAAAIAVIGTVSWVISHPTSPLSDQVNSACLTHAKEQKHLDTSEWGKGVLIEQPGHFDMRGKTPTGEWTCWGMLNPIKILGTDSY